MKIVAIVQARMGSSRLPGKVMKDINSTPVIEILLNRLKLSKEIDQIIIATSEDCKDKVLVKHLDKIGFKYELGDENDVLSRYYYTAKKHSADVVVRITGDCPLIDPKLVDKVIQEYRISEVDYAGNVSPASYPDGLDVEVMSFSALQKTFEDCNSPFDKEHVTTYIRNSGLFKVKNVSHEVDLSNLRWTLDEDVDLEVINNVFNSFKPNIHFSWLEVLSLYYKNPEIFSLNSNLTRNEGASMGSGQKLWKKAKKIIPGGNMLLSKRSEMFLPDQWPSYFSRSKGCTVWDLDEKPYIDMGIMGIGTNTLGYGHPEVDEAVIKAIKNGNMSTLNAPEEVYLAEKLIEMHPWADMARFARSGGEANAVAIRIARAASGKDGVAICGYHGWHDWYLSANLGNDKSLSGHLLPGLDPAGVPRSLIKTTFPFNYNDFDGLEKLVNDHENNIGTIKMEVVRNKGPEDNFLQKVRSLATRKGIILIFDECTSGFRESFGGIHKKYNVEPDMAMFGKALGNGYAVTSIIGSRSVMEAAQSSFISSTFWTERIGSVAALKTLEVMERECSWEKITSVGLKIRERWEILADKYDLKINHFGIPALAGFNFESHDSLKFKTLITQEMLNSGYLASNAIYVCTEHTDSIIDGYFDALDPIFSLIKDCEEGQCIDNLLNGPVCHAGFKRLN
jgi:glutamate-1-semialdehyde 2,1-aminomutase